MGNRKRKRISNKVSKVNKRVRDDALVSADAAVGEVILRPCTLRSGRILTPHVPPVNPALIQRVVTNSVVLAEIFRNLYVGCLKKCRLVCQSWNDLAKPFLLHSTVYDVLHDDRGRTVGHKNKGNLKLTYQLPYPSVHIGTHPHRPFHEIMYSCGEWTSSSFPNPDDLANAINYCTEHVEYLRLGRLISWKAAVPTFKSFPTLSLRRLKTLVLNCVIEPYDDGDELKQVHAKFFGELIGKAPYLEELSLGHDLLEEEVFPALCPALHQLSKNLQVLTIDFLCMENRQFEMLRGMKMRLKRLVILMQLSGIEPLPGMVGWIDDMKETLTSLELYTTLDSLALAQNGTVFQQNFLSEMPVLRSLKISDAGAFGFAQIPDFLSQLPVLEVLHLTSADSLDKEQFILSRMESLEVFPRVKDFLLNTEDLKWAEFPWLRVSKLFPNLKRVFFSIFSLKGLSMLSEKLEDSQIEHLTISIYKTALRREKAAPPTRFSQWRVLHKFTIHCFNDEENELKRGQGRLDETHPPLDPNLLSTLSEIKNLTFLELRDWGKIELASITKLVLELPLLRYLIILILT